MDWILESHRLVMGSYLVFHIACMAAHGLQLGPFVGPQKPSQLGVPTKTRQPQ